MFGVLWDSYVCPTFGTVRNGNMCSLIPQIAMACRREQLHCGEFSTARFRLTGKFWHFEVLDFPTVIRGSAHNSMFFWDGVYPVFKRFTPLCSERLHNLSCQFYTVMRGMHILIMAELIYGDNVIIHAANSFLNR